MQFTCPVCHCIQEKPITVYDFNADIYNSDKEMMERAYLQWYLIENAKFNEIKKYVDIKYHPRPKNISDSEILSEIRKKFSEFDEVCIPFIYDKWVEVSSVPGRIFARAFYGFTQNNHYIECEVCKHKTTFFKEEHPYEIR